MPLVPSFTADAVPVDAVVPPERDGGRRHGPAQLASGLQRPGALRSFHLRMRWRPCILLLACASLCALVLRMRGPARADVPRSFPSQRVGPGRLPGLWIFVRAECPHCRRHLLGLEGALRLLPDSTRARACARLNVCGDLHAPACARTHARSLQHALGVRATPVTWWVAADSSICRAWWGARDRDAWASALAFVRAEAPR